MNVVLFPKVSAEWWCILKVIGRQGQCNLKDIIAKEGHDGKNEK